MKSAKNLIAGLALIAGLIGLAAPASAAWSHDRDFSRDRRELAGARHELYHDLRRGAGQREIARDRAAIARERRDICRTGEIGAMTAAAAITGPGIAGNTAS